MITDEVMRRMGALVEYAEGTGVDLYMRMRSLYGETIERNLDLFETFGSG